MVRAGPGLERAISRGGNWVRFKITRSVLLGCAPPGVPSSFCFRSDSAPPGGRGPGWAGEQGGTPGDTSRPPPRDTSRISGVDRTTFGIPATPGKEKGVRSQSKAHPAARPDPVLTWRGPRWLRMRWVTPWVLPGHLLGAMSPAVTERIQGWSGVVGRNGKGKEGERAEGEKAEGK